MQNSPTQSTTKPNDWVIKKITCAGFRGFISWVGEDDGHLNPVFIATFAHPTLGDVDAYVKLYPYTPDNRGFINEITGYLYGHALGVPQPKAAFMAEIPLDKLQDISNRFPVGHWLSSILNSKKTWPGFCTTRLDGRSAALHMPDSEASLLIEDVAAWNQLPMTVAMDENIAHVDRHLNNLIRISKNNYAVIDNGRLVNPTSETWSTGMLDAFSLYANLLSQYIWDHKPENKTVSSMLDSAKNHCGAIATIENELFYWMGLLLPKEREQFRDFLASRTEHTEWLIRKRYNHLL